MDVKRIKKSSDFETLVFKLNKVFGSDENNVTLCRGVAISYSTILELGLNEEVIMKPSSNQRITISNVILLKTSRMSSVINKIDMMADNLIEFQSVIDEIPKIHQLKWIWATNWIYNCILNCEKPTITSIRNHLFVKVNCPDVLLGELRIMKNIELIPDNIGDCIGEIRIQAKQKCLEILIEIKS